MIKIGIDLDGGDYSSSENIKAVVSFLSKHNDVIVRAYTKDSIELTHDNLEIVKCKDQIKEDDGILSIRKKPNSSMVMMMEDLKSKKIESVVSAGNSGVYLSSATLILGTTKKELRPAFAPMIENVKTGQTQIILDGGANVENSANDLVQYAHLGSSVIKNYAKNKPQVGLANNGTESKKGDELRKEVFELLKKDKKINFIGNIEPRELISSDANVIVTDGWSGNMMVKSYEGMARQISISLKSALKSSPLSMLASIVIKKKIKESFKKFDYREYGASLILGVNGVVLKAHGESDIYTMENALVFSKELAESKFLKKIT